jgi:hypothetical protein
LATEDASADAIGSALTYFAVGTVASVLMFAGAYFTQLQYGNTGTTLRAQIVHNVAYVALLVALGGFVGGIWCAKIAVVAALT